jgi:hypothetical protein
MTAQPLSSTARASDRANNPADDGWTFRADDPVMLEMDVFQLDCIVDRLKGADLTPYRAELARIAHNLADLLLAAEHKDMAA